MRYITTLLTCLLALFGVQDKPSATSITRITENGQDVVFSKTVSAAGLTTFECVRSKSGQCHYLVYEERCTEAATADAPRVCEQHALDQFALRDGGQRQLSGTATSPVFCVSADAQKQCRRD